MTPPAPTPEQPKHRADVPVDSCVCHRGGPCDTCLSWPYTSKHRAAVSS